jgi:hypothetical protein
MFSTQQYKMKKLFCILLLLSTTRFCNAQNTADELAQRIVQCFQQGNYNAYKSLHITNSIYVEEMRPLLEVDFKKHNIPGNPIEGTDTLYRQSLIDTLSLLLFNKILKNGTEAGIKDWQKIKFSKLEVIESNETGADPVKSGYLWLQYNGEYYCILGFTFMKSKHGYRLLYVVDIGKSKNNVPSIMPSSAPH